MVKIHILDCGTTLVDEALPLADRSVNPLAFTGIGRGEKHKITVPVTAYLIECPGALILVDTGWDTAIRTEPLRYEGIANYFASPGQLPDGKAVTEHLDRLGYRPEDIDYCILTHLDIDHAGGLQLIKGAKHIMASNAEWAAAQRPDPRYRKKLWDGVNIESFPDKPYDLLGNGIVTLLPLHGHSSGMTGVKVKHGGKFVIITGDSAYCRESWEDPKLPGIVWNKDKALRSLQKVQRYARNPNCVEILATHDSQVKPHTIIL